MIPGDGGAHAEAGTPRPPKESPQPSSARNPVTKKKGAARNAIRVLPAKRRGSGYAAKLVTASDSDSYTSKTVMSWVTVKTSLILGGR